MQLGWFLHMQKQNGPQLPILMQRLVLWIFFLKNCVVELVSRIFFAVSLARQLRTCDDTLNIFYP
jgi:hypothetical protein